MAFEAAVFSLLGAWLLVLALTGRLGCAWRALPALLFCALTHATVLLWAVWGLLAGRPAPARLPPVLLLGALCLVPLLWLHIAPARVNRAEAPFRVRLLYGGRSLIYWGLFLCAAQALIYPLLWRRVFSLLPRGMLLLDAILCALLCLLPLANGLLRVLCLCRRLNLVMRLVVIFTWWVPLWGVILLLYCARKAWEEYDHECNRAQQQHSRNGCGICRTRYPLVLVHGVGFRDLKYFNYWGRIPKLLQKNGATIYYGNQEAWGTVECNAADLKEAILRVLREQDCDKVNIIAHSKGGLDSRYLISVLGMAEQVASLTTICTPHHGSRVIDRVVRMPDGLYRRIARAVDRAFTRLGDQSPDFYTASRQFTTAYAKELAQRAPDMPGVYYQSYAAVMRGPFSDCFLTIPYCILRPLLGENDGLVDVSSAKWGEFRGVFRSTARRGVSHGDMIDLHRDDYRGFDVAAHYVDIVSELRAKGF